MQQQGTQSHANARGRRPRFRTTAHVLAAGLEIDLRSFVAQWVLRLDQRPQPKATLINVETGKSASINILCVALAALASSSTSRESIAQFCRQLEVRLRKMAPLEAQCPEQTLERELLAQGRADFAQYLARPALRTGNTADLDRAIDESLTHRNALDDLIECLIARRTETTRMPLQLQHVS